MRLYKLQSGGEAVIAVSRHDDEAPIFRIDHAGIETMVSMAGLLAGLEGLKGRLGDILAQEPADARLEPASFRYLPPIDAASRIFCIGRNYRDHAREVGGEAPPFPDIFLRLPSSFVGHHEALVCPADQASFDYEGEIVIAISRPLRRGATRSEIDAAIGGLTLANDATVREWQRRTSQYTLGKNADASGAMGPYIVAAAALAPFGLLGFETRVDDEIRQQGRTAQMVHDPIALIAAIIEGTALRPGDMILTGTPAGVGAGFDPPRFLRPGQRVTITLERIAELSNPVSGGHD